MLSFTISYPDLMKLPYFVELTPRGGIGAEKRPKDKGGDRMTFNENSNNDVKRVSKISGMLVGPLNQQF
jgi:hypothetical protein